MPSTDTLLEPLLWKKLGRCFLSLQVWLCHEAVNPRIDMEIISIGLSRPVSGYLLDRREAAGHFCLLLSKLILLPSPQDSRSASVNFPWETPFLTDNPTRPGLLVKR